jgi:hypothetical protein
MELLTWFGLRGQTAQIWGAYCRTGYRRYADVVITSGNAPQAPLGPLERFATRHSLQCNTPIPLWLVESGNAQSEHTESALRSQADFLARL